MKRFFKLSDFECRCDKKSTCNAAPISSVLIENLVKLREAIDKPFYVTSGSRCTYWNQKYNGSVTSYHLKGMAVDFSVKDGATMYKVAMLAPRFGFNGIGISKGFIHLDIRDTGDPVMFGY